VRQPLWFRF